MTQDQMIATGYKLEALKTKLRKNPLIKEYEKNMKRMGISYGDILKMVFRTYLGKDPIIVGVMTTEFGKINYTHN